MKNPWLFGLLTRLCYRFLWGFLNKEAIEVADPYELTSKMECNEVFSHCSLGEL